MLTGRNNAYKLFSFYTIKGEYGVEAYGWVFLPDNFIIPSGLSFRSIADFPDNKDYRYCRTTQDYTEHLGNIYTVKEWQKMEEAGAVFLKEDGYAHRGGPEGREHRDSYGCYWLKNNCAIELDFDITDEYSPITRHLQCYIHNGDGYGGYYYAYSLRPVYFVK